MTSYNQGLVPDIVGKNTFAERSAICMFWEDEPDNRFQSWIYCWFFNKGEPVSMFIQIPENQSDFSSMSIGKMDLIGKTKILWYRDLFRPPNKMLGLVFVWCGASVEIEWKSAMLWRLTK